jgi:protein-S-isoprenylcysteine O-methyltransferase Ste14
MMGRSKAGAAAGTAAFLVAAPGVVAGLGPWLLTGATSGEPPYPLPLRLFGGALIVAGGGMVLAAFARFVVEGRGTPAPVAPTEHLVVGGLYRYVRNPMYIAVAATIIGQALLLSRPVLFAYAAGFMVVVGAFVHGYEEPTLGRMFGAEYWAYRRAVPAWWPRLRPWHPS